MRNHGEDYRLMLILDPSGSMAQWRDVVINGANSLISQWSDVHVPPGDDVTVVLFRTEPRVLYENLPGREAGHVGRDYLTAGMTALYDAVGATLAAAEPPSDKGRRRRKVLCVIATDGEDNASAEYDDVSVSALIGAKEETGRWEFRYPIAGPDRWVANAERDSG